MHEFILSGSHPIRNDDTPLSIAPMTLLSSDVLGLSQEVRAPFQAELEAADANDKECLTRHLQNVNKVCKIRLRYRAHVNSWNKKLPECPVYAMSWWCLAVVLESRL